MAFTPEEEPQRDVNVAVDPGELTLKHQDKLLSPFLLYPMQPSRYNFHFIIQGLFLIAKNSKYRKYHTTVSKTHEGFTMIKPAMYPFMYGLFKFQYYSRKTNESFL